MQDAASQSTSSVDATNWGAPAGPPSVLQTTYYGGTLRVALSPSFDAQLIAGVFHPVVVLLGPERAIAFGYQGVPVDVGGLS